MKENQAIGFVADIVEIIDEASLTYPWTLGERGALTR
jgi:hypothetical protein